MIAREELYKLVWSIPMTKAAEKFLVSGSYMARVCSVLNVPHPRRGYWAKLAVDKAPPKPELPEALPGDPLFWSQDGYDRALGVHAAFATSAPARVQPRRTIGGIHGLIQGAKQHYLKGYRVEEGQLLRPHKRQLVDVTASTLGLEKALAFANDLFNALESAGCSVRFSHSRQISHRPHIDEQEIVQKPSKDEYRRYGGNSWCPSVPTLVYVGDVPFGLAVIEMTEPVLLRYVNGRYLRESEYTPPKARRHYADHTWTTTKEVPSGRLRLVVYCPQREVSWSLSFQETIQRTLTQDIPKIVKSIKGSVSIVQMKIQEAEHEAKLREEEWQQQQERWRREEDQREITKSINDSREQLSQIIQSWAKVISIDQFFKGVQERACGLSETERVPVQDCLRLAREFVGGQDPLAFFLAWKLPEERYMPLDKRAADGKAHRKA